MQRFKNILVVYTMIPGDEDTLDRATDLARRNGAHLTVLHVYPHSEPEGPAYRERSSMVARIAGSIALPHGPVGHRVRRGDKATEILLQIRQGAHDLVILTGESMGAFSRLFGRDAVHRLMSEAACPVWVSRPTGAEGYRRIVAAVDVSDEGVETDRTNRRVLRMAASLAGMEGADLDIFHAWDFSGPERETMESELPPTVYRERVEKGRFKALGRLVSSARRIFDGHLPGTPVVAWGEASRRLIEHVEKRQIDLLVMGGTDLGPIASMVEGSCAKRLLVDMPCPVLFAKPILVTEGKATPVAA